MLFKIDTFMLKIAYYDHSKVNFLQKNSYNIHLYGIFSIFFKKYAFCFILLTLYIIYLTAHSKDITK